MRLRKLLCTMALKNMTLLCCKMSMSTWSEVYSIISISCLYCAPFSELCGFVSTIAGTEFKMRMNIEVSE